VASAQIELYCICFCWSSA